MLVHADNFSLYGGNAAYLTNGVYAEYNEAAIVTDPDGISVGKVLRMNQNPYLSSGKVRFVLPSNENKVGISNRLWLASLPSVSTQQPSFHIFKDGSNNEIIRIHVDTTGRIVVRNHTGSSIYTTTNPVITANGWYHVETKVLFGVAGDATIEVRIEGVPVVALVAQTLSSATCSQVEIRSYTTGTSSAPGFYIKDYVIWNGSGARNTDFLGSVIVYDVKPTADVAMPWTSTGANGWSIMDDAPPNDANYISAAYPPPAAAVFTMSDLPPNVSSVKGLFTWVRAAKTDGGDAQLQVSVLSAAATGNGADRPITVAQTYWRDLQEVDPNTGVAWLPGAVDAMTVKVNRTV